MVKLAMIGTVNQIEWAEQIKIKVNAEFDRVRKALETATQQAPEDLQAILQILEDKRAEVMTNENAGYFIHDWEELRDQVRRLILADDRHNAIRAGQNKNMAAESQSGSL